MAHSATWHQLEGNAQFILQVTPSRIGEHGSQQLKWPPCLWWTTPAKPLTLLT